MAVVELRDLIEQRLATCEIRFAELGLCGEVFATWLIGGFRRLMKRLPIGFALSGAAAMQRLPFILQPPDAIGEFGGASSAPTNPCICSTSCARLGATA